MNAQNLLKEQQDSTFHAFPPSYCNDAWQGPIDGGSGAAATK